MRIWWYSRKPKQAPATVPASPQPEPKTVRWSPNYTLPAEFFEPNRVEEVVFSFTANYHQAIKYREELGLLDPSFARATIPVESDDTITFTWRIVISYFGRVTRGLAAILKMAEDPDMLVKVKIDELQHGRSLLIDTLRALDAAILRIQSRDAEPEEGENGPC